MSLAHRIKTMCEAQKTKIPADLALGLLGMWTRWKVDKSDFQFATAIAIIADGFRRKYFQGDYLTLRDKHAMDAICADDYAGTMRCIRLSRRGVPVDRVPELVSWALTVDRCADSIRPPESPQ